MVDAGDNPIPGYPVTFKVTSGEAATAPVLSAGSAPITSYTVSATDQEFPTAPAVTATGSSSPIAVKGPTDGDPYGFTVTATSADGPSPSSKPSGPINVGVGPTIVSSPANGTVNEAYSSRSTFTGAPAPTVTLACAVRMLTGSFPPLEASAAATLVRGTATYAIGCARADYRELTLTRRREILAGGYTLVLRRPRRAFFVPVVFR